jgi:hypothetical protein
MLGCQRPEAITRLSEIEMVGYRKIRKVQGRSNALMTVYECDSCLWIVNVPYEKKFPDVQQKFDNHDCNEKPFRQKRTES